MSSLNTKQLDPRSRIELLERRIVGDRLPVEDSGFEVLNSRHNASPISQNISQPGIGGRDEVIPASQVGKEGSPANVTLEKPGELYLAVFTVHLSCC